MRIKKIAGNVLVFSIRWLHRLHEKLLSNADMPNEMGFDDLAPTTTLQKDSPYCKALEYAIQNPRIKNIALTGNYGSGKSSVLESFRQHYPQYRYLNISLAVFDDVKHDTKEDHKQIEISILQQIFYHVKHRNIPDSRFKRIRKQHWLFHLLLSTIAAFTVLLAVFILKPAFIESTQWWKKIASEKQITLHDYGLVLFGTVVFLWMFIFLRSLRRAKLSKLNLIKGEIEIEKLGETSILNNNLDEILYFFEVNSFDVVVIEDLDRFQEPVIFTKLREINSLINNSRQIDRKVTFVYAIKDEMFKDATRAKFFEFIIPVIPVINSSNSADIFFNLLHTGKAGLSLSENFVNDMSLYVEDMRMLKNSINEYITYRALLSSQLNSEKLFGLILYKNLFPSDFAQLPLNKGIVYGALQSRGTLLSKFTAAIKEEIENIDRALAEAEKEGLDNVNELRLVYIGYILSKFEQGAVIYIDSTRQPVKELLKDEVFTRLTEQDNIRVFTPNIGNSHLGASFSEMAKDVHPKGFKERVVDIENKQKEQNNTLRRKRLEQASNLENLKAFTLADILENFKDATLPDNVNEYPWLSYLLRNGYIDETYQSYISFFYEGSITRQDREYLFSIKNNAPLDPDHSLTNIMPLIKRIWLKEFETDAVLNFDMMDFLLHNKEVFADQLSRMFSIFSGSSEFTKPFLFGYFKRRKNIAEFLNEISRYWSGFFRFVYETANFPDNTRQEFLDEILGHVDMEFIKDFDNARTLISVLENDSELLWRAGGDIGAEKLEALIKTFGLRFYSIQPNPDAPDLFDVILENNAYQLNAAMVETIVMLKWLNAPENLEERLAVQNYSTVLASGNTELTAYIEKEINTYATDVLLSLSSNSKETEEVMIKLVNNEMLSLENKTALVSTQECRFSDIDDVPEILDGLLFENNKVIPTWANVMKYFGRSNSIDRLLATYLSLQSNANTLAESSFNPADPQENDQKNLFETELLKCNLIPLELYKRLARTVDTTQGQCTEFDTADLDRDKVLWLISERKIYYSDWNWNNLKNGHSGLQIALAAAYPSVFIEKLTEINFDENDFTQLLSAQNFSTEQHFKIIEAIKPEQVTTIKLASLILSLYYNRHQTLPPDLLLPVFQHIEWRDQKVTFLSLHITSLEADVFVELLDSLGEPFNQLAHAEKSVLPSNAFNLELVTTLKAHGFISSYSTKNDEIKVKGAV